MGNPYIYVSHYESSVWRINDENEKHDVLKLISKKDHKDCQKKKIRKNYLLRWLFQFQESGCVFESKCKNKVYVNRCIQLCRNAWITILLVVV